MQDVTSLNRVDFSDVLDLGQTCIPKSHKGKMVDFLDKFGDSETINEQDQWDILKSTVPEKLRIRDEL